MVLLTHTKLLAFKGLYACSAEEDHTAERVFGLGPPQVDAAMVSNVQAARLECTTIPLWSVENRLVVGLTPA